MLLQRRFIVAQRGAGAQLPGQLLRGLAHHAAAGKSSHRLQAAVQKQRAHHCFHGIGEHGALAPEAAAVFAAAEAQMAAQADGRGHLRHVLAAHQLGADAGQFALLPLRVQQEQRFGHHQAQHRVAQKLQALIVACARGLFLPLASLFAAACWLRQRAVRQRAHQQLGLGKTVPQRASSSVKSCFHMRLGRFDSNGLIARDGGATADTGQRALPSVY